jgi:two-component system phosphate regulon sensor histidine kinase PhoR
VKLRDVVSRLLPEARVRAKWRSVELDVEMPDDLASVNATYEDMEHLLANLINNAIKYTNPGGRVTVKLWQTRARVGATIEDTGIGIAQGDLERIFDDFYRADAAKSMDAHGTGLGLSIAKSIVELYGGEIRVESTLGKGSRFEATFPRGTQ